MEMQVPMAAIHMAVAVAVPVEQAVLAAVLEAIPVVLDYNTAQAEQQPITQVAVVVVHVRAAKVQQAQEATAVVVLV
jgi:hypothetical protein